MKFLLDTNVWIACLNDHFCPMRSRIESLDAQDVAICSVVKAELIYGAMKSHHPIKNIAKLDKLLNQFA